MQIETVKQANFIVEEIRKLDYHLKEWKKRKPSDVVEGSILARINLDENFSVFRDGVVYKMEKEKQLLEEALAKL